MKKSIYSFIAVFVWLLVSNSQVYARVLPRFVITKKNPVAAAVSASNQYVSGKLRADRKALLVNFTNMQNTRSVEYILTYTSEGVDQGVTGTIDLSAGNSASRTLVFGTESKGVYTYHTNIKNMRFVVTVVTKAGKTVVKKFTIKP